MYSQKPSLNGCQGTDHEKNFHGVRSHGSVNWIQHTRPAYVFGYAQPGRVSFVRAGIE